MSDDCYTGSTTEETGTDPAENGGEECSTLALGQLFEVLTSRRRRLVLHYFRESSDEVATYGEVVDYVAAHDGGDAARERIVTALHHSELPRLAECGIVERDARSRTVRYRGDPLLEDWVTRTADRDLNP